MDNQIKPRSVFQRMLHNIEEFTWASKRIFPDRIKKIDVIVDNDNDWEFVFIDKGHGVKGMSVF